MLPGESRHGESEVTWGLLMPNPRGQQVSTAKDFHNLQGLGAGDKGHIVDLGFVSEAFEIAFCHSVPVLVVLWRQQ